MPRDDSILVDTNVVSFMHRQDTRSRPYEQLVIASNPYFSVVSLGELLYGARRAGWSQARTTSLMALIDKYAIVGVTEIVAEVWAQIRVQTESIGRSIPYSDSWIAATAIALDCPIVTHNPADFEAIDGLEVISFA